MSEIYKIIALAVIVGLSVAFFVLFANKTSLRYFMRDYLGLKGINLIAKMLDCDLCLCFWLSFIVSLILGLTYLEPCTIVIPILSTPIARFLL